MMGDEDNGINRRNEDVKQHAHVPAVSTGKSVAPKGLQTITISQKNNSHQVQHPCPIGLIV